MNLKTARITGYFSIPSATLAEHNPTAYSLAMAGAPAGAGTCAHCGTGILHHVIIRDEAGQQHFIGTQCAVKVGCDAEQIKARLTDDQKAERDAKRAALADERQKAYEARIEAEKARLAVRREFVGELLVLLRSINTEFHSSLASQLEVGPLSERQAHFVAKATSATGRRNKGNAAAWDNVMERCTLEDDELLQKASVA